jgi:hypothetical protein
MDESAGTYHLWRGFSAFLPAALPPREVDKTNEQGGEIRHDKSSTLRARARRNTSRSQRPAYPALGNMARWAERPVGISASPGLTALPRACGTVVPAFTRI